MQPEFKELPILKNEKNHAFEMRVGDDIATIAFGEQNEIVTLFHTTVPETLRGKGVGSAIIEKTLVFIRDNKKKVIPLCPFVIGFIKKNPVWNSIVTSLKESSLD